MPDLSNFKCFVSTTTFPQKKIYIAITGWINRHCCIFELVH